MGLYHLTNGDPEVARLLDEKPELIVMDIHPITKVCPIGHG
jgi:hypothetical protein